MPKSSKSDKNGEKEDKSSKNILQKRDIIISPHFTYQKVDIQDNTSYNPFSSGEKSRPENSANNSEIIENNKIENESNSSPNNEKKNQEIININTPSQSQKSDWGNSEEICNSSTERKKEKLKKDLTPQNNNNTSNNNNIFGENSPSSINNEMQIEEWDNNKSGDLEIKSKENQNKNNINNHKEKEKTVEWGEDDNKINDKQINDDKKQIEEMNIENDKDEGIREDKGPLPEPKDTKDTFANFVEEKNKKESEMTWFNRDGRKEKDEYAENNIKKLLVEHEKLIKRKESDKISELESLEFQMYYVKVTTNEEPKLLHDQKRPRIRFENLNKVPEQLRQNINQLQYDYLTPIQRAIMPYIQVGKDIVCVAETGSGKTLSYLFPIIGQMLIEGVPKNPFIEKETENNKKDENKTEEKKKENEESGETNKKEYNNLFRTNTAYPLALIIVPSRELATQISNESKKLAMNTGIKTVSLIGGEKRNYQYIDLAKGCDILVSTPLRLTDFLNCGKINLKMVKYLVLDEAEKMLEPDFYEQLKSIFDKLPMRKYRQNLLFSATFNDDVKGIAKYCLNNYYYFCPIIESPKQIKHEFYHFENGEEKIGYLLKYLKSEEVKNKSILIFMNSKKDVDILNKILQNENIKSCAIHGDKVQADRKKAINEFKLGYKNILISTDIISRGMDFPNIYSVINYDMPNNIDDYIHRIGRTGRMGQKGIAITYVDQIDETSKERLIQLLQHLDQEVPSWINDIESNRRAYNFSKRDNNNYNNSWNNSNDNENNFKRDKFNKNNNYKRGFNKDNNRNNNWKKKDNNDDWGNTNDNKKDNWRDDNHNNNRKDDWKKKDNNDEWGSNDNNTNKDYNNKKSDWDNNNDEGWGKNDDNKKNNNENWNNKNDGGCGNSPNKTKNNNNNDSWGNSDNKFDKNENKKNRNDNNDGWDWGDDNSNNKNENKDDWQTPNNNNNDWNNNNKDNDWNNSSNNNRKNDFRDRGKGRGRGRGRGFRDRDNNIKKNDFNSRDRNNNSEKNNFSIQQNNDDIEIPEDAYEELFIMGINYESIEDDLKDTFSKYGEISSCKILKDKETGKSRGIGFVKFGDKKSAVKAMNDADNLICKGRNLRIRYANNKNGEIKGKTGGKKFDKRNDDDGNNTWGNDTKNNENSFNDKGKSGRGRGNDRGRGRGRGRGRDFNRNNKNDNNEWGNNNGGWEKNDKKENNNDCWGDDNNGNGKNNKEKEKNDSWADGNDDAWGNNNERERSRDKDNNKNVDEW